MNKAFRSLSFLILIALFTSGLYAQEVSGQKPTLNDHTFVPVNFMNSPFVNTNIRIPIGVGSTANFDLFPEEIDTVEGLKGEVLFATLGMLYPQKIRDWINFYLRFGLTARLGTNVESIISQGFNTVINFEVGSMIVLRETTKTMLSMSVEVQNYNANFVDINGYVRDVLNDVTDAKITRNVPRLLPGEGCILPGVSISYWGFGQKENMYMVKHLPGARAPADIR